MTKGSRNASVVMMQLEALFCALLFCSIIDSECDNVFIYTATTLPILFILQLLKVNLLLVALSRMQHHLVVMLPSHVLELQLLVTWELYVGSDYHHFLY